jgi:hypothetical protein
LEGILHAPTTPTTVTLSLMIDQNIDGAFVAARQEMVQRISELKTLSAVLADVRVKIAAVNVTSGIEQLLADMANIDRQVKIVGLMSVGSLMPSSDLIMAELQMAKAALTQADDTHTRLYGARAKTISFGLMSPEDVKTVKAGLTAFKREREALEDKRAFINSSTFIEISDDGAELLTQLGII